MKGATVRAIDPFICGQHEGGQSRAGVLVSAWRLVTKGQAVVARDVQSPSRVRGGMQRESPGYSKKATSLPCTAAGNDAA